jgi:hypothetical protein
MGNKAISLHPVDDSFCGGARLTRAPQADSRARARDERGGEATERIGWGGCGGNWCPVVAASSRPHAHSHRRIESVGEGVAVLGARLSQRRLVHIPTTTHAANRLGREWPNVSPEAVRSSYGRISRKPRASARGGYQSPLDIFIPRLKTRVFSLLFIPHVRYRIDRSGTPLCHVFCV